MLKAANNLAARIADTGAVLALVLIVVILIGPIEGRGIGL